MDIEAKLCISCNKYYYRPRTYDSEYCNGCQSKVILDK